MLYTLANGLIASLTEEPLCIIGIDLTFSFPVRCFEVHGLPRDWHAILKCFRAHCPADQPHTHVDFFGTEFS